MPAAVRHAVTPIALAALAIALLAGCTPDGDGTDPSATPSTSGTPSGEPSPEPTDAPVGVPISATCDDLVSPDTLYIYNPNFGPIDGFTPDDGTPAASALAYQGVACRWQNQTSGDTIDLSVAQLDDDSLTALKNAAFEDSEMVPTYGEEAYFTVESGVGVAQVFQGPYWIVAESPIFFEPGDATELIQSVLDALS
jgi:hypothetical protein